MLKRIIPCLDVKNGQVVKGVQFQNHKIVGDILTLAQFYTENGADELVFYDITASCESRLVDKTWVNRVARLLDIPFCVAGGIRTLKEAETILNHGADKISINSPALENPEFINMLAKEFGSQSIVVGIDCLKVQEEYKVCQYTGNMQKMQITQWQTDDWLKEVQSRGAGEIVLNCMNQDGIKNGYDISVLRNLREICQVPLIASGGAGELSHFLEVFKETDVDGALAASVFHSGDISVKNLKAYLQENGVRIRQC